MKNLALFIGFLFVCFCGYKLLYKPCIEPDKDDIQMSTIICVEKMVDAVQNGKLNLHAEACSNLKRESNCVFTEADQDAVQSFLNSKIISCVEKELAAHNMCSDKVKELFNANVTN